MDGCLVRLICRALAIVSMAAPLPALADAVNNEWLSSTRALSMGNVGIASADDPIGQMFYNPAGLSRNKKTTLEVFNPQLEAGIHVFSIGGGGLSLGNQLSLEKAQPALQSHPHKASYLGFSLFPNITTQNFGFGIAWREQAVGYINSQDKLEYHSKYLMIPTLGLSMNLLGNRFRLGAAVRAIQLTENNRTSDPDASGQGYLKDAEEGFGLGLDAGAMLSLPWAGLPTLGFVARNLGGTSFGGGAPYPRAYGTVTRHNRVKMTYDAGFSIASKPGRGGAFTFATDFRDILNHTETNMLRHINLGTEWGFGKALFFRLGVSQGYWTAGFGLASKFGTFDLGSYGEELDKRNFREIEDRRISIRFATKF